MSQKISKFMTRHPAIPIIGGSTLGMLTGQLIRDALRHDSSTASKLGALGATAFGAGVVTKGVTNFLKRRKEQQQ